MNKKNRFSMLEIEPKEKENTSPTTSANNEVQPGRSRPINHIKVIVEDEEFSNNLKHHKLKAEEKEIHQKKKIIESRIFSLKKDGWIKIILGVFIIASVVKKYTWGERQAKYIGNNQGELTITRASFNMNDFLIVVLILIFIYFQFFANKKKK